MTYKQWSRKLLGSIIQGGSHAGGAYLGLALAHAADIDIPALNIKALCVVVCSSAILKMFNFLDANPIPDDDDTPKPPDKFTESGGLSIKVLPICIILSLFFSGCQTTDSKIPTEEKAKEYAGWVQERSGFIEDAVASITRVAVYETQKDTFERTRTLEILKAVAGNLNALVHNGIVNPDEISSALRINEPYFGGITSAIASLIQVEMVTFKENGYADLSISILEAVSAGIRDGATE